MNLKRYGPTLVFLGLLAAALGAAGVTIYNHVTAPPTNLAVSIDPSGRHLLDVGTVRCSLDREGVADASGYLGVDGYQYLGIIKVTAAFYRGNEFLQGNDSYIDTTDTSENHDPGVHQSFSVVGNEPDGASTPTSCRITASEQYGSTMVNGQPNP